MPGVPRRRRDEAIRITTAPHSREAEIAMRQRRYLVSMAIRTVCFVAAILVGGGVLRWLLVAAAVLLPYVAVVLANVNASRSDGFDLPDNEYGAHQLDAPTDSDDQPGPEVL